MLQEGMRDLLKDVDENPEMHGQFEALAKELNEAMAASTSAGEARPGTSSSTAAPTGSFQDQIRQTMERMKSSSAEVDAGLAEDVDDDFLAQMLKSMGGGEAGEEDFSNMLVNMMEQLTSKEILYEPMKELNEKYPAWMKENEAKTKKEDLERYRVQMGIVREIVERFDRPSYKDENEEDREYIVERMQKMQSAGAPPAELMGDMTEGMQPPDMSAGDCGVQ
ncbi:Pex19 protein [Pyronema omphalodes]|nr:Pex19 protein [Pyronema omphalodes]